MKICGSCARLIHATKPSRIVYLRTLANLVSPSEVRSALQIGRGHYEVKIITSDLIAFANRILPHRYAELVAITVKSKNLLFAKRNEDISGHYSEFHMSAGERALLHISKDISQLRNALILIDEIEAGLHPYTQQQTMLELQRLALRNDLQIVVTSHSPVVLDCVPVEARVFLERTATNVEVKPPFRDIIQKAFYGQSLEKLSILCEDDVAEYFLFGILDYLNPKLSLVHDDIVVGRDTGKEQFTMHIEAIGKFKQLESFLFVLDGDARNKENELVAKAQSFGSHIQPLFLPGDVPEEWAWQILGEYPSEYATIIGHKQEDMLRQMDMANRAFNNATDKKTNILKNKFFSFCETIRFDHLQLIRHIAKTEAERQTGEIKSFVDDIEIQIRNWQSRR
ncbi:MAG: AAA family ATPase [Saprospiraceae bacterium]